MKKLLAFILTAVLAVTAFSTVAFAAESSPEKIEGIITAATGKDANGKEWRLVIKKATGSTDVYTAEVGSNTLADHKLVALEGQGDPKYPMDITFTANGIKATDKGYILYKGDDGKIQKLSATFGNGTIAASFPALGEFVLVLEAAADSSETPKSDPTSDNVTPVAFALLLASAAVAMVSVKKIRNAA